MKTSGYKVIVDGKMIEVKEFIISLNFLDLNFFLLKYMSCGDVQAICTYIRAD
jgi:hypothetical protein